MIKSSPFVAKARSAVTDSSHPNFGDGQLFLFARQISQPIANGRRDILVIQVPRAGHQRMIAGPFAQPIAPLWVR